MSTPIPITHGDLTRLVAEEWLDAARQAGADPHRLGYEIVEDCRGVMSIRIVTWVDYPVDDAVAGLVLTNVLDALERRYLVVERGEVRVLGWAAAIYPGGRLVRLAGCDPTNATRRTWDERCRLAREAHPAPAVNPKFTRARAQARAHAESWERETRGGGR